jgi:hypothetical protein
MEYEYAWVKLGSTPSCVWFKLGPPATAVIIPVDVFIFLISRKVVSPMSKFPAESVAIP